MNCKICFETYNSFHQPVTLMPCGHSICLPCLHSLEYTQPSSTVCPQCRCEIFCSKPNYDLIEVLEHQDSSREASSFMLTPSTARIVNLKEIIEKDLRQVNEQLRQKMRTVRTNNPEINNAIGAFKTIFNRIKYNL